MRGTSHLDLAYSLQAASTKLSESGGTLLPVVDGPYLIGVVTQQSVLDAIAAGAGPESGVKVAVLDSVVTLPPHATCAEALRTFEATSSSVLVVVDDFHRLMGVVSPSDLIARPRPPKLPPAGGMATPFGVYLTNGNVSAGPNRLALMCTGAVLFGMIAVATVLAQVILYRVPAHGMSQAMQDVVEFGTIYVLFGIGFRVLPLTGIHAAEHMVVHAMERGEELTVDNVRRMPRVHPRCGTNIAMGATIFALVSSIPWTSSVETRYLVALVATVLFWRRLGAFAQYYVTTRTPTDKHLKMGIRSAKRLIELQLAAKSSTSNIPLRLWRSGLFEVYAGSALCAAFVHWALAAAGYPGLL